MLLRKLIIVCALIFSTCGITTYAADNKVNKSKSVTKSALADYTVTVTYDKEASIYHPLSSKCSNYNLLIKDKESKVLSEGPLIEGFRGRILGPANAKVSKDKIQFEFLVESAGGSVGRELKYVIDRKNNTVQVTEKKHKHPLGCWHCNIVISDVVQTSDRDDIFIQLRYKGLPDWYAKSPIRLAIERGSSGKIRSMDLPSDKKFYMVNAFITDIDGDKKPEVVLAGHALNDSGSLLKVFSLAQKTERFEEATLQWGSDMYLPKISEADGKLKFEVTKEGKDYTETTVHKFENNQFVQLYSKRKKESN